MDRETATRARIAAVIYMMINGVIFGTGLITVMTVPALADHAAVWIPLVVAASFVLAAPVPGCSDHARCRTSAGAWALRRCPKRERIHGAMNHAAGAAGATAAGLGM